MFKIPPRLLVVVLLALAVGCGKGERKTEDGVALEQVRAIGDKVVGTNKQLVAISAGLREATELIVNGEDPTAKLAEVRKIKIAFSAGDLAGTPLAALPADVFEELLDYTARVHLVKARRDSIVRLMRSAVSALKKHREQLKNPTISYSIVVRMKDGKRVADIARNESPFSAKGEWPAVYGVTMLERGKANKVQAKRFDGGTLGVDQAIPMSTASAGQLGQGLMVVRVRSVLMELVSSIEGTDSPSGGTKSLIDNGAKLAEDLKGLEVK